MKSTFLSQTCRLGVIKQSCTQSPFLCWAFGIMAVLGVPLGLIVAFESQSPLKGCLYSRYIAEIATTFEETRLDNTAGFLDFDFC